MSEERTGIRQRHVDLTRETILRALVEIITEGGLADFSIQQVADRAGVSHRTVYRHFPGRADLLDGLMAWVEQRMAAAGGRFDTPDADATAEISRQNFAVFEVLADDVEAATRFSLGTGIEPASRAERTRMLARRVEEALPDADADQQLMVAGVVRLLVSTRAWLVMRQDGVAPPERVADALAWAVETVLAAVRTGRLPPGGPG